MISYSHYYLGQGAAGGRRLALEVSSRIRDSTFARCRSKSFARYGVAHCSWGVCVGVFPRVSDLPGVGLLVVSLGLSLVCRVQSCPACFNRCPFWELRATTNGAVLRESQKLRRVGVVPSSLGSNNSRRLLISCSGSHPRLGGTGLRFFQSGSFQEIV